MAFANDFVATGSDGVVKANASCLGIPPAIEAPTEVAQHKCSSLRVLKHITSKWHKSTFQSADATYAQFWKVLYIGGLDATWKVDDLDRLKHRFQWVLEFIESGSLPPEAQNAEKILYEDLKDTALSSTRHPYSFEGRRTDDSLLNPDLSPVWVKEFLIHQGRFKEIDAWEKAMYTFQSQCYLLSRTDIPASLVSPGILPRPETKEKLTALDSDSGPSHDQSPPADSPTEEEILERKGTKWSAEESEYLEYLLELGDNRQTRIYKFTKKFPHRGEYSLDKKEERIRKVKFPEYKPAQHKRTSWTTAEREYLIELIQTLGTWDEILDAFNERFDTGRTKKGPRGYASENKLGSPVPSEGAPWTDEEDVYLKSLREEQKSLKEIAVLLEEKFGVKRSSQGCKRRALKKGFTAGGTSKQPFTEEEEDRIREWKALGLKPKEVCKRFWDQFGTGRSKKRLMVR
ncbi:unnamed protein product [Fusarium venenatum]|uniref:Myb-like domain-containing protein n=1 Tax=Fusarium venenatum TaxID=56646 RepID=A0A2L2TFI2_9HYPO|nr:uncharacterized protein FVRRES_09819 [Fusarium venenatum]KAH6966471.1 hypothetical protein EDB82DRAFT_530164 [Fusarium venenatum]CEI69742.1 unnamed protein product [Fusarium venenatum]